MSKLIRIRNKKRIEEACIFLDKYIGQGLHQSSDHIGQKPEEHAIYGAYIGSYSLVGVGTAYLLDNELDNMDSYFLEQLDAKYGEVGYMESVAVEPDFRGKGIGTDLIRARIQFLESIHVEHIVALCWNHMGPDSHQSLPIYSKLGFEDVEHFKEPFAGTPCPYCGEECKCDATLVYKRF